MNLNVALNVLIKKENVKIERLESLRCLCNVGMQDRFVSHELEILVFDIPSNCYAD